MPRLGSFVAGVAQHVTRQLLGIDRTAGGDLTADQDQLGGGEGLAGDPSRGVIGPGGVHDGVGNLVAELVGWPSLTLSEVNR